MTDPLSAGGHAMHTDARSGVIGGRLKKAVAVAPRSISDEVYSQIRRISEDAAAKSVRRGSAEQLIGDFWATGMDAATIYRQGLSPLQPDLDRIDRIQTIADVIDVVATMHRRTMLIDGPLGQQRVFFSARVEQDESNSRRRIYTLSQGGVSMGRDEPPRIL